MSSWHKEQKKKKKRFAIIASFAGGSGNKEKRNTHVAQHTHTHTDLWFDRAVDGWGASGLHAAAAAAEGLGAGREGGV